MTTQDLFVQNQMQPDEIPVGRAEDLRGQKFGQLTVLYRVKNKGNKVIWKCQCDCGNITTVNSGSLKNGHTKSCGCLKVSEVLVGHKFGKLTVLQKSDDEQYKQYKRSYWVCQCDCGNIITVRSSNLKSGNVKSCGCLNGEKHQKNLIGQKFGKLTVLYATNERSGSGNVIWHCKCECGNETDVSARYLLRGSVKSCGLCGYSAEVASKNLLGQKFGKLTVIEKTDNRQHGNIVWKCQCECGNIVEVQTNSLISGNTQSCGCINSKGEYSIIQLLLQHNIQFQTQKSFDSCRFIDTQALAKFDFYILEKNYLIEFDGRQHYGEGSNWGEGFDKVFEHDEYKNQWCKENNIPLIRIPYWHLDNLTIEDLLLETTTFRVV